MANTLGDAAGSREAPLASHCVICGTPLGGLASLLFRVSESGAAPAIRTFAAAAIRMWPKAA